MNTTITVSLVTFGLLAAYGLWLILNPRRKGDLGYFGGTISLIAIGVMCLLILCLSPILRWREIMHALFVFGAATDRDVLQ